MKKILGFIGGAMSFAVIYMASSSPIPLYTTYRQMLGLSNADLSISSVLYFAGTVISLLFFARLSNYLGRRPVILSTLVLSSVGCLMFLSLNSAALFLVARFVQGLSCGLGSGCIAAYIVDIASGKKATIATSSAPMIGLALGSFGSGALAQYGYQGTIYLVVLVILAISGILVLFGEETVQAKKGAATSLCPQISAPGSVRKLLPAASAVFVGTWAIGGFYQAFSAPMAAEQLGTTNLMVAAAVFACLQAPNIIGSTLAGKMETDKAQKLGMAVFLISIMAVIFSLSRGTVAAFLISSGFAGASWGLAYAGSMRGIMVQTQAADRAGVLSTIYIISYSGAAIPNLIVGKVSAYFDLFQIAVGYGILVLVTCIITFHFTKGNVRT